MNTRIYSLFFVLVMCLLLIGCSSNQNLAGSYCNSLKNKAEYLSSIKFNVNISEDKNDLFICSLIGEDGSELFIMFSKEGPDFNVNKNYVLFKNELVVTKPDYFEMGPFIENIDGKKSFYFTSLNKKTGESGGTYSVFDQNFILIIYSYDTLVSLEDLKELGDHTEFLFSSKSSQ